MDDAVREKLVVIVGAVVAVLLQIVVAPAIAIGNAMPNIIMMYALTVSIVRPMEAGPIFPFVLGLVYDLLGSGPVGSMSFLLVLVAFLMARAFQVLDNDAPFMPVLAMVLSALALEVLYGAFMLGVGVEASILDALVYRALPCALYDAVMGAVLYVVVSRLMAGGSRAKYGQQRF